MPLPFRPPGHQAYQVLTNRPKSISAGMLRRPPTNLNQQAQNATVLLIREVLARGVQLAHVYVDALGRTTTYEAYLSALFPDIGFTVQAKADQTFKIVGAASVAAKVTRDAWIEGWVFEEARVDGDGEEEEGEGKGVKDETRWGEEIGSGYPSGE